MVTRRIDSLDGLRGVAALVVVVYHCLLISPALNDLVRHRAPDNVVVWLLAYTPFRVVWAGQEAVWIFFVLSGFVLIRPYLAGRVMQPRRYLGRRFIRLYLPFFGSFVLAVALRAIPHEAHPGQSWWMVSHARPVPLIQGAQTATLVLGNRVVLDNVWWSLQWEVWFSLLLPLVVFSLRWISHKGAVLLVGSILVSAIGPVLTRHVDSLGHFVPHALAYLPMFTVGVAIALLEDRIIAVLARFDGGRAVAVIGIAIGALTASLPLVAFGRLWNVNETVVLIVVGVVGLVGAGTLVASALALPVARRGLTTRPVHWLGVRSYSLYLVHEPIIVTGAFVFALTNVTWWSVPLAIAVALVVTAGFYRAIEAPTLRLLERLRPKSHVIQ